jgi:hypothetical protein
LEQLIEAKIFGVEISSNCPILISGGAADAPLRENVFHGKSWHAEDCNQSARKFGTESVRLAWQHRAGRSRKMASVTGKWAVQDLNL